MLNSNVYEFINQYTLSLDRWNAKCYDNGKMRALNC